MSHPAGYTKNQKRQPNSHTFMKETPETEIIMLEKHHSEQLFLDVASLHIRQISHGVLSRLGPTLLSRIYREIALQPGSGVWVALHQGKVAVFISGCQDTRQTFRRVIIRVSVSLALFSLGMLVRLRFLKFIRILLYPGRKGAGGSHASSVCIRVKAELLSIAISDEYQQLGIGKRLIETFEKRLVDWKVADYYKVASDLSLTGSQQFYLRSGFQPCHTLTLNDTVLQIYVKEISPPR